MFLFQHNNFIYQLFYVLFMILFVKVIYVFIHDMYFVEYFAGFMDDDGDVYSYDGLRCYF